MYWPPAKTPRRCSFFTGAGPWFSDRVTVSSVVTLIRVLPGPADLVGPGARVGSPRDRGLPTP
ncbi:hypothetical protein Kpho01_42980 [Kitasatospora phosalacinea]|uniref:Uncharacterized protein n=1 Tax=Kitasatospora phosalacinea TaxID=2065 RepID=A0A9W6PK50_9ACTN|nr:hypothetical protein Kpho01_42980 [Kitasatospora phosalacinea]